MRLDVSQQVRLEQRMKLSPRIIQAMEILQLPLMALQERIEEELTSNPCLERREGSGEDIPAKSPEAEEHNRGEEAIVVDPDNANKADFERLAEFGDAHGEDLEWVDRPYRRARPSGERDIKLDALANTPARSESLIDHLLHQWAFVEAGEPIDAAGRAIISNIDDDGYLRTPPEELVNSKLNPPITLESLNQALGSVQKLDPLGVGARDLRECLLIQLDAEAAAGHDVELSRRIVSDFLREVEMNRIPLIARRTDRSVEEVNEAISYLARLDPRPGRRVGQMPVPYITPDAMIDLDDNGQIVVSMRDGNTPSLKISRLYRKLARSRDTETKAREFIRNNLRTAQWLIGAIQQRRRTVRRVIEEVFAVQQEFLEQGPEVLRPLPMTEVAAKIGVHVATISRAVAGKYIQTPRGVFPLRMFFSGGTAAGDGEDVAWDAIKARLRDIVDKEDKSDPLADDQIAAELSKQGIKIARRTVAKYRNLLNIPPARKRRQY